MKLSSIILLVTLSSLITAMFFSNILLKNEYEKIDKNEHYWNYGKILQEPFKHLKITGGNETNFIFEESDKAAISVFKNWEGYENKVVKATVKHDTLFVDFNLTTTDHGERESIKRMTMVRIFAPQLLSVDASDNNLTLSKIKQKNITIDLKGRSSLLVQSYLRDFEMVKVRQQDSSKVVFQMAPESKNTNASLGMPMNSNTWDEMFVRSLDANISGVSMLDFSHARIDSLKLEVADTSSVLLSGQSLKKLKL